MEKEIRKEDGKGSKERGGKRKWEIEWKWK